MTSPAKTISAGTTTTTSTTRAKCKHFSWRCCVVTVLSNSRNASLGVKPWRKLGAVWLQNRIPQVSNVHSLTFLSFPPLGSALESQSYEARPVTLQWSLIFVWLILLNSPLHSNSTQLFTPIFTLTHNLLLKSTIGCSLAVGVGVFPDAQSAKHCFQLSAATLWLEG